MVVPKEIIHAAEEKIEKVTILDIEIRSDIAKIGLNFWSLKQKIIANVKSEDNPSGLLTRKAAEYIQFLSVFDPSPLESLLEQETAYWMGNLEAARKEAARIEADV